MSRALDHDAAFPGEQKAFMAALGAAGLKYEQVKAAYLAAGLPKPSAGGSELRRRLTSGLRAGMTLAQVVENEALFRDSAEWSLKRTVDDYRLGYLAGLEKT